MENSIDQMYTATCGGNITTNESNNSIYFNAGITPKTMSLLIENLLNLEKKILKKQKSLKRKFKQLKSKEDDVNKETEDDLIDYHFNIKIEPKPILLYITSNGGYVYQVFSAIDTIRSMEIPVHTICCGFVASAGTLLSLAGKKRFITENSYMLIHELRSASWGKFTHLEESFENSKQLMEHIKSYYLKYTKLTSDELNEQLKKDISWNAIMCLEKGLVDEIIINK